MPTLLSGPRRVQRGKLGQGGPGGGEGGARSGLDSPDPGGSRPGRPLPASLWAFGPLPPIALEDAGETSHESDAAVERAALALCRARGELRAELCVAASALRDRSRLEPLGFVRLRDFVGERLGVSSREFRDFVRVGRALGKSARLGALLRSGELPWSKIRVLARVVDRAEGGDGALEVWIDLAKRATCLELERRLRVEKASRAAQSERAGPQRSLVSFELSPLSYAWWARARQLARRQAGRDLSAAGVIDRVIAEALAAVPVDAELGPLDLSGDDGRDLEGGPRPARGRRREARRDPFELDRVLRDLVRVEQRIDARLARLLSTLKERAVYRARGYARFGEYVRERIGLGAHRLKTLLRVDRVCQWSPELERAFASGAVSCAQAECLVPLLESDRRRVWHAAWVARARGVTLRRLTSDVELARRLQQTAPEAFRRTGGLPDPDDHRLERELRDHLCRSADPAGSGDDDRPSIGLVFLASDEQRELFRAVLEAWRVRLESWTGRAVSEDLAFGALLAHACVAWGELASVPREHRVYARDGWRCQVPGCSGRRNLHAHHIWFAGRGGPTVDWNLVTLCAAHHRHGVHAGRVEVSGRAPEGLRFALGVRVGERPLAVFRSGDRVVSRS